MLDIQVIGIQFRLASHVILPTILLGLLVVYIVDGTVQARPVIQAVILVAFLLYVLQIYMPIFHALSSGSSLNSSEEVYPLRVLSASTLSLVVDAILLVILYQAISNLRRRFPSIFAGELALWGTLTVDALLFSSLNFAGTPQWGQMVLNDWGAKTLAALALYPLNYLYIKFIAPTLPDTAATTPRPTLDLFNTQVELEDAHAPAIWPVIYAQPNQPADHESQQCTDAPRTGLHLACVRSRPATGVDRIAA